MKKLVVAAAGETPTHIEKDATLIDIVNPTVPVDATGGIARAAVWGAVAIAGTSKYTTGSFLPKSID